jgi:hypothetical protein
MKRAIIKCFVALSLLSAAASAQDSKRATSTDKKIGANAPLPIEHGGKIVSEYDGFTHETVVSLKKMTVSCDNVRSPRGVVKGVCVRLAASLHCPGKQLDYVRYALIQLTFESKDWDSRHPLSERELSVVADGETMRLGRMQLAGAGVGEGWLEQDSKEMLEVAIPFDKFQKIARAGAVEMSVGKTAFELREKNVAALKDLTNRVKF